MNGPDVGESRSRPASLPPAPPPRSGRIGEGPERIAAVGQGLGRVVWPGTALVILTLGLYRFWYRTHLRRWYWANTRIGGDGLVYRGTPRELLIGFLIAIAVTLPLYVAGAIAALFLASDAAAQGLSLAGVVVLAVLAQYGAFRARRYRLTRTEWRGLRLDQAGSAWRYAGASMLWGLIVLATLGLAFPLARRALEGMKMRATRFGDAEGRFDVRAGKLMLYWLPCWLAGAAGAARALPLAGEALTLPFSSEAQAEVLGSAAVSAIGGAALLFLLWPIYRAAEFRIFAAGSAIGPVTFESDLSARRLYGLYLSFGLALVGLTIAGGIGGLVLMGMGAGALYGLEHGGRAILPVLIAATLAFYLVGVYLFMALRELILSQGFWRRACESVTVHGLAKVEAVTAAKRSSETAAGEGLADALDFGGV